MTTINPEYWQMALAKSELRVANVLKRGQSAAMSKLNTARAAYNRAITGRPAMQREDADFETEVAGIPCGVVIDDFRPGLPAKLFGPPENCYPEEPPEADFHLVDRTGYAAEWLERKLTARDRARIEDECIEHTVAMNE